MKLKIDISVIWKEVEELGVEPIDFKLGLKPLFAYGKASEYQRTATELKNGKFVLACDVESVGGLLQYKEQQILLYIPYEISYSAVIKDPSTAHKFHVAECSTIKEMRSAGRIDRYIATTDHSGLFTSFATVDGVEKTFLLKRNVCRNCLIELNYKDAATYGSINSIVHNFSIEEFFDTYSPIFSRKNMSRIAKAHDDQYPKNWGEISYRIRSQDKWKCSICGVDLSEHHDLLHVHHKNGVKGDVSRKNLVSLCAVCHRRQPFHDHMQIPLTDIRKVHVLRRRQKIAFGMTDPIDLSIDGIFGLAEKAGWGKAEGPYHFNGLIVDAIWREKSAALDVLASEDKMLGDWMIYSIDGLFKKLHE